MKLKLAIVSLLFFIGCTKEKSITSPLLSYVPQNSAVIIKINDKTAFSSDLGDNDLLKSFAPTKTYSSIVKKIQPLDYLQTDMESVLAFVELGKGNFEILYVTHYSSELFNLEEATDKTVEQITYEGQTIEKYSIEDNTFFSIELNNKIIISSAKMLLENLLRKEKNLSINPSLNKLNEVTNNESSANIFINTKKSTSLLSSILADGVNVDISKFTEWVYIDFKSNKDHIKLNGIITANETTPKVSDLFRNTHALVNRTPSLAPMAAEAILSYTFDDYGAFASNQKKHLDRSILIDNTFDAVEEIGLIHLKGDLSVLLYTNGSEKIHKYFDDIKTSAEEYQGHEIVTLSKNDFLNLYFDPLIKNYSANFYTIIENAFVFGSSAESLKTIIANYKNNATFDKTATYKTAKEQLADESTILFVANASGIEYYLDHYFSKEITQKVKTKELSEYSFAAQMVSEDHFHHTNILFQKIAHETSMNKTTPLFTLTLDSEVATVPQFVKNHHTNKEEIVVQDQQNKLYLISTDGKILWKKQLNGRIQGRIEQVDLYKNGRLQLAFTTDNQFLILDRNGKEVPPFSFSYEGGILNPLAVFDYERRKDYRFVLSHGNKIYMYNRQGKIVSGFKFKQADQAIQGIAKHFRIGRKDYLVFKEEGGKLNILSRTGTTRIPVKENIAFSDNEVRVHKNKFTLTDTEGRLYQIDQNGKMSSANLNLLADHGIDATSNTMVIMNDNELSIRGKKVELELGMYSKPRIFYLNDKIYVSVTDIQNQKIYLFDSQAKPISDFPVPGSSLIDLSDMDNDHKLELVTKDQNNSIIVYRIN
ncbi:MAG: ribonuclease HII [Arenibacter latericius]|nr:ribonuclease HII [Arenibacter latericius]